MSQYAPSSQSGRAVPTAATVCLVAIGLLFGIVAVLYFVDPATDLPSFMPGHDLSLTRHRTKHGILAALLAASALVAALLGLGHRAPSSRVRSAPHGLAPPGVRGAHPPEQRDGHADVHPEQYEDRPPAF